MGLLVLILAPFVIVFGLLTTAMFAIGPMFWDNSRGPPVVFATVPSPSGGWTAVKQIRGDIDIQVDILLVQKEGVRKRSFTVLQGLPEIATVSHERLFGADGILMGWDGDGRLTVAWPEGVVPKYGPATVGGVDVSYRTYPSTVNESGVRILLGDVTIGFTEVDAEKAVPSIRCTVAVRGIDPTTSDVVGMEIIANGIGAHSAEPGIIGRTDLAFSRTAREGSVRTLTRAALQNDEDAVGPVPVTLGIPQQIGTSLVYRGYGNSNVLRVVRSGKFLVTLGSDFDRSTTTYLVQISTGNEMDRALAEFGKCVASTNVMGFPSSPN